MKLAVVSHSLSRLGGGIPSVLRPLCRQIQRDFGDLIKVFGLKDKSFDEDLDSWGDVPTQAFAVKHPTSIGIAPEMMTALRDFKPDVAHAHGIWRYPSHYVSNLHDKLQIPYVVSTHGMLDKWALEHGRIKKRIAKLWFESKHLTRARCLHALCEAEAKSMRDYGLRQPIFVIPNAINIPESDGEPGIPDRQSSKLRLLFLGRIHPKKGLSELIRAWASLGGRIGSWELQIAGWDCGGYEAGLKAMIHKLGISGSVEFVGPVFGEDKSRLMKLADAFVLPSYSEGLPMTVLEAWAYRLPVLKTEFCNLPEGFQAGAAIRISPTQQDLSSGIEKLIAMSPAERKRIGEQGRMLVEQRFTWPSVANKYRSMYQWMLGGDRPSFLFD